MNKGPFWCHSSWHLSKRLRRILPSLWFQTSVPSPHPHSTNKEFKACLAKTDFLPSLCYFGSWQENDTDKELQLPKRGQDATHRSPTLSPFLFLTFQALWLAGGTLIHLSSSANVTSCLFNTKLCPSLWAFFYTHELSWLKPDWLFWQDPGSLAEKLGGMEASGLVIYIKLFDLNPIAMWFIPSSCR